MKDLEKRILDFIALATPVNNNTKPCNCNVKLPASREIERLSIRLGSIQVVGRTDERQVMDGQLVLHPAPWVRKLFAIKGRDAQ